VSQQKRAWIAALVVFAILLIIVLKINKPQPSVEEETATATQIAKAPSDIEEIEKNTGEPKEPAKDEQGMIASPVTPDSASSEPTERSMPKPPAVATPATEKPAALTEPKLSKLPVKEAAPVEESKPTRLPRFVEIGAEECIPCRMMQPILVELRAEYAGKLQVDFVDVWKHPEQADEYGIRTIPTQVIYDSSGKEVFRHIGFWPKDEILAKFKELGIDIE